MASIAGGSNNGSSRPGAITGTFDKDFVAIPLRNSTLFLTAFFVSSLKLTAI